MMNPVRRLLNSPTSFSRIVNLSVSKIELLAEDSLADIFDGEHKIIY